MLLLPHTISFVFINHIKFYPKYLFITILYIMKDFVDQWKIILFGSTIVFMYQLYTDLKTYRNQHQQKPIKKGVKICLTGGP